MKKLYCVRDILANICGDPVSAPNDDVAVRYFADVCARSPYSKDFVLLRIGSFDEEIGLLDPTQPEKIMDYDSLRKQVENISDVSELRAKSSSRSRRS